MTINNLPTALQNAIQQGYLERTFQDTLRAKLGFRDIADREPVEAGIGESVTKTRLGLLPSADTPIAAASNTDLTSGFTIDEQADEQYELMIQAYGRSMMLNVVTSRVMISSKFLQNVSKQAEQAARSIDTVARKKLFNAYIGGNSYVTVALTSAGTSVHVNDLRGFQYPPTGAANSSSIPVSVTNPLTVVIGSTGYTCVGATADGTNSSTLANFGGISGTLTLSSNVATSDAVLNAPVISSLAAPIFRPNNKTSTAALTVGDTLTITTLLAAKAQLGSNSVPMVDSSGMYRCYATELQVKGLYADPLFASFMRGRPDRAEYRKGVIAEMVGLEIVETNNLPIQVMNGLNIYRAIVVGQGALIEGTFTAAGYEGREEAGLDMEMIKIVDDIGYIVREPIDAAREVVTTSWKYYGDFCAPTDTVTNPSVLPTASNAAYKRGVIVEST